MTDPASREPSAACPPHDFGQDEGLKLSEMLQRSCCKCGASAAELLGMMVRAEERNTDGDE